MVINYLNFVFVIEVKAKSKYRILNFVFQLIKTRNGTLGSRTDLDLRHPFIEVSLVLGFIFFFADVFFLTFFLTEISETARTVGNQFTKVNKSFSIR